MSIRFIGASSRSLLLLAATCGLLRTAPAQVVNGSFESGDFSGWSTQDLGAPYYALDVVSAGFTHGWFGPLATPTDGRYQAHTGFDGNGPGTISLAQDLHVPKGARQLLLDHTTLWDMTSWNATAARTFTVRLQEAGGGPDLASFELVREEPATWLDPDGWTSAVLGVSSLADRDVRLLVEWQVPEYLTGPGSCVLDDVRFVGKSADPLEAASLKAHVTFDQQGDDTSLLLSLVARAPSAYEPEGTAVSVTVGDYSSDFVLDAKGQASEGAASLAVKPIKKHPGFLRLVMKLQHQAMLGELAAYGMTDADTPPKGVACLLPVSADVGGTVTSSSLCYTWKAKAGKTGSAKGKAVDTARAAKLKIALDLANEGNDTLTLVAHAAADPGFLADGVPAEFVLGGVERSFILTDGKAVGGPGALPFDSIKVKRLGKNPALYTVTLKLVTAPLATFLADLGLVNEDVPAPGVDLLLPVTLTLGEHHSRFFIPVTWKATADKSGKAIGSL